MLYLSKKTYRNVVFLSACSLLISAPAFAAGYQVKDQSARGQGQAFAGATADSSDLSTLYFNPAGMMRLKGNQMEGGLTYVLPSVKFSANSLTNPTTTGGVATPLGTDNGGDAGVGVMAPSLYAFYDYRPDLKFGLSINAPFGLTTEYDANWVGRYHAIKSELLTVNVSPSIGYRINESLSIGAAASIQYIQTALSAAVQDVGTNNAANDGRYEFAGDDIAFGGRLGLLYELNDQTRLGLAWHSRVKHTLEGELTYEGLTAATEGALNTAGLQNKTHKASTKITTPDIFALGISHDVNDKLTLLGEVSRTQWTTFTDLTVLDENGTVDQSVYENWTASHFVAVGGRYKLDEHSTLRAGLAYDQSAVNTQHRTARIPDADRYWLSLGYGYQFDNFDLNLGYTYVHFEDADLIETDDNLLTGRVQGSYETNFNVFSVNATWQF